LPLSLSPPCTLTLPSPPHPRGDQSFNAHFKQETIARDSWNTERKKSRSGDGKKKNYQRYPKPPYSYLAMIAMVIQRSPEKKLTLSEILKEISTLFPFFKGNYKGWRDSVRHNLSSYDCFVKVLKDPGKPQGKGNFWAVELSRVPLELLKRQNTAVSRQDETIFAQDLAPYILQGHKPESEPTSDPAVTPPWELPTSYAKYAPPNAVAPPSMRFNGGPLMPLHGGLPLYGYGSSPVAPGHFLGHAYWPILPSGRVSVQAPPLIMDLDNMLQSVPPNKSVFDILTFLFHLSLCLCSYNFPICFPPLLWLLC
uniref:Forkhead box H1 n=1 Tax=Seriola lalandi dorsalis TaxID=1841481 RepID=A0A3B4X745_SERLL